MDIYTCYKPEDAATFRKVKRRTTGPWTFLISGEWSQSPYHQGNHQFHIRSSPDKTRWALMSSGFPSRIIAVAQFGDPTRLEVAAGEMMRSAREHDGDYIDMVHDHAKGIDLDLLWKTYRSS